MKPRLFPAFAVAALALVSAAARADDPPAAPPTGAPPPSGRFFDTYDANLDGKVTKEEFAGDAETFALLDKNADGVVTPVELGLPVDYRPRPLEKPKEERMGETRVAEFAKRLERFKQQLVEWDADRDGKVTKEEYKGKASFDLLDFNKDGVLTVDDMRRGGGKGPAAMNPDEARARFKEMDKDGDGRVTKEEYRGPTERFPLLDRDGDACITKEELEKALQALPATDGAKERFKRMDKDGDGKVSRAEFPGGDDAFKGIDKDGDGFLSREEVGKPGSSPTPPKKGDEGAMPPPPPAGDGMMPAPDAPRGLGLFGALDKNGDGRLSREEFSGSDDEWRRLDVNRDGWISREEAN